MSQPDIENSQKTKVESFSDVFTAVLLYSLTLGPGVCSSSVFLNSNAWWLQTCVTSADLN